MILINQNSRFLRNTKRKCIKSPCSFQKPPLFTVYDLKQKKSNTLNKRKKTRLFDKLHIAANFNSSPIRLLSGGLRPNLARILYLITKCDILLTSLLFCSFIIATMQNIIAFPRAGDGIAYALCTSLINSISLQTLSFRQSDSTTAGFARTLHTFFI